MIDTFVRWGVRLIGTNFIQSYCGQFLLMIYKTLMIGILVLSSPENDCSFMNIRFCTVQL